jgi:hypothetical protein
MFNVIRKVLTAVYAIINHGGDGGDADVPGLDRQ